MHLDRFRKSALARPAALLALAAFAPLAVYAVFNAYLALDRRQAALTQQSIEGVQAIVENVDRQIATSLEDAETLAEAPALDQASGAAADLGVFKEVARRTRERHRDWLMVILLSPDGRWVYSTDPTADAPNRRVEEMGSFQQVLRTGRPVVGDVVKGAHGRWGIPLRAPVLRDGKVVYVVTVVINPMSVRETLSSLRTPGPWVTFVVNAQGHVVARLPDDAGRSMGVDVTPQTRVARQKGSGGGSYPGRGRDGVDNQTFYWVSPKSNWSAHAAIPRSVWEAPLRQMLAALVVSFLVCLLLGAFLVVLWWRDYESRRRQSAAVELATRIDALGRLTGGVAHDFNNLLTVISGNTEILGRRVKGQAQADRPLAAIRLATDRAAQLTRQLLVFARGGAAEQERVDLSRKVVDLLGPLSQLAGAGVAIETDLEAGAPPVSVDPLQLEAALLNLAANARDAMDGAGTLHFKLRRAGALVALSVRDEGPGFDPGVLPRVFDPFFTTKPVGQGTGLGLSQVYGLVKGSGGRVEAANAPGGGAIVTLYFPAAEGGAAVELAEAEAPSSVPLHRRRQSRPGADPAGRRQRGGADHGRRLSARMRPGGGRGDRRARRPGSLGREPDGGPDHRHRHAGRDGRHGPGRDGQAIVAAPAVLLVSGFSERAAEAQARGFAVISKPYSLPDLERRLRLLAESRAVAEA